MSVFSKPENPKRDIAIISRMFIMATLPHSKIDGDSFERKNGNYTLRIEADPEVGIPYGALSRVILIWISTEAFRKKSREIYLGKSLASFMRRISLRNIGGKRGTGLRVKEQIIRLLCCHFEVIFRDFRSSFDNSTSFDVCQSAELWWSDSHGGQSRHDFKLVLSEEFYNQLVSSPVPIDMDAIRHLRGSPLQLDLYVWLTYRYSFLKNDVFIPWIALMRQFGCNYSHNSQGLRNFKKKFKNAIFKVWQVYPEANVTMKDDGLLLCASDPHVKKKIDNAVDNVTYSH